MNSILAKYIRNSIVAAIIAERIVTWSDNRWSTGEVYPKIGFSLEKEYGPDYSYVDFKRATKRISKQSQKKNLTNCPEGKTEREWCAERGLARIWDCGKKKWVMDIIASK